MSEAPAVPEQALVFTCGGETLLGIVSPAVAPSGLGVVIVVGGPQYRAGSHRQFVSLARALAAAGFPALRFDYRGMGDSEGALRNFEHCGDDIAAAIDAFITAQPGLQRVVLWGLCDGASAALLYLHARRDARVAGLALLNPWVRSEASLAKTHVKHYYAQRLKEREFWMKLLSGKVAFKALSDLAGNLTKAFAGERTSAAPAAGPFQQRMAQAWAALAGPVLLLLSERDLTAQEFSEFTATDTHWKAAFRAQPGTRMTLSAADHTCSTPGSQQAMEAATCQWLAAAKLAGGR
jgi:exosortase A-associated hydrolase 1